VVDGHEIRLVKLIGLHQRMIYFTADTHFGHVGILKHQPHRRFATIEDMDAHLIDSINRVVGRNELWILGDFAWNKCGHYRMRIKAKQVHIVTGNHDKPSLRKCVSSMRDMVYRKFDGQKFHLTHYPMIAWRTREHGSIHLYGHCHGAMEKKLNALYPGRRAMDVGIDNSYFLTGEFRPFSLDEILERLT